MSSASQPRSIFDNPSMLVNTIRQYIPVAQAAAPHLPQGIPFDRRVAMLAAMLVETIDYRDIEGIESIAWAVAESYTAGRERPDP